MFVPALAAWFGLAGCQSSDQPSRLAARSDAPANAESPATPASPTAPATPATPNTTVAGATPSTPANTQTFTEPTAQDQPVTQVLDPAPAQDPRYQLFLALKPDTTYKVTTIGMVQFSVVQSPTGFAREELITISGCEGEAGNHVCALKHAYHKFDAEPPQGSYLKNDEKAVADIVTTYRLNSTGMRTAAPELSGPEKQLQSPPGKALAAVDRMYCLRFPDKPVAVGATWQHTCNMRTGGFLDTRLLTWKLLSVSPDPITKANRAELAYTGRYRAGSADKPRDGGISGRVYMWLEAGEPHLIKEQIEVHFDSEKGLKTSTTSSLQFSKLVDPNDPSKIIRTDGMPFPNPPKMPNEAPAETPAGKTTPAPKSK